MGDEIGRVISMHPVDAFYHERLGTVVIFSAKCDPDTRDYVAYMLGQPKQSAQASVDGFIRGYTGKFIEDMPCRVPYRFN